MIKVKLFAYFRENRGKELSLPYFEGLTLNELVERLGINPKEVSIMLINGKHQTLDAYLSDGDTVALFPPVAGG